MRDEVNDGGEDVEVSKDIGDRRGAVQGGGRQRKSAKSQVAVLFAGWRLCIRVVSRSQRRKCRATGGRLTLKKKSTWPPKPAGPIPGSAPQRKERRSRQRLE